MESDLFRTMGICDSNEHGTYYEKNDIVSFNIFIKKQINVSVTHRQSLCVTYINYGGLETFIFL